jgi:hypothetical protein
MFYPVLKRAEATSTYTVKRRAGLSNGDELHTRILALRDVQASNRCSAGVGQASDAGAGFVVDRLERDVEGGHDVA